MAAMSSATVRRSPSTLRPIMALRWNPSIDGSVTATICTTPDSTRRWTRWRTAASDRPTCFASFVYGIRPSSWRPSISALSMSSITTTAVGRSAGSRSLRGIGFAPVCRSDRIVARDSVAFGRLADGFSGSEPFRLRKSFPEARDERADRCQDLVAGGGQPGPVAPMELLGVVEPVEQHQGVEAGERIHAQADRVDRAQPGVGDEHRETGTDGAGEVDVVTVGREGGAGAARALHEREAASGE